MNDDKLIKKFNENKFSLISINIRSLTKHLSELKQITEKFEPDIITLSEIWRPHGPYVAINNYHEIIMNVRPPGKSGGGTAIYVKKTHKIEKTDKFDQIKLKKIEISAIKVISNRSEVLILSMYRPPDCSITDTINDLDKILSNIGNLRVIISGDTNIDYGKKNHLREIYNQKLLENNLLQYVNTYTRITAKSQTIIDHTISNINSLNSVVSEIAIADHQMIATFWGKKSFNKNFKNDQNSSNINETIHFSKTLKNIQSINWNEWQVLSDDSSVDDIYNSFHSKMQQSLVFEKKKTKKKFQSQPWFTNDILTQKKQVEKARKKFLKKADQHNEITYRILKKNYNKNLKLAKNEFYADKLQKANKNSKLIWRVINELLNRSKYKDEFERLTHNNTELTDHHEIAKTFADYYKSAAHDKIIKIKSDKKFTQFLNPSDEKVNTFDLKPIDIHDTWKYIKTIQPKNSSGFDGFPSKLLNLAAPSLLKPLTIIINKCFETGEFPEILKLSKIFPVFKKGLPECSNFRPVSLLSCFSKVIEKASNDQLEKYLNENYDTRYQFAYKKNHSTLHPILLTRHISEIELMKKNFVIIIMIDLSLAFDTIDTGIILPEKFKFYGANDKTAGFFRNFFTQREHYVKWKNVNSDPVKLYNYSCVQGSTLAAPIFNFYTQDLKNVINSNIVMFADDKNIILSGKDPNKLILEANEELDNINQYMAANKLIVNKTKTSFMILKPKGGKKFQITEKLKMGNVEINQVSEARFLGVILDDQLSFKKQYEVVKNKLENTVKALICTRNLLNYKAKFQLYNALFESHVNYCCIAYMDKLKKGQIEKLKSLQKKAIRLIFNAKQKSHTNKLFKLSNITPIQDIYENEALKFVFKNTSVLSSYHQPVAIRDILLQNTNHRQIRTRFDDDDTKIRINNQYTKGQAIFDILDIWNNASYDIRNAGNLFSLKRMLKNKINTDMNECTTENCYSCRIDVHRDYSKYMKI